MCWLKSPDRSVDPPAFCYRHHHQSVSVPSTLPSFSQLMDDCLVQNSGKAMPSKRQLTHFAWTSAAPLRPYKGVGVLVQSIQDHMRPAVVVRHAVGFTVAYASQLHTKYYMIHAYVKYLRVARQLLQGVAPPSLGLHGVRGCREGRGRGQQRCKSQ